VSVEDVNYRVYAMSRSRHAVTEGDQ